MAFKRAPKGPKPPKEGRVQDIIPIKRIYRGMIITNDDRYVRIMEFTPINFSLRSVEEQNNIIYLFQSWLRVAPVKLQFKVITRRADTNVIVNNIRAASADETEPKCKELVEDHIHFIRRLAGNEALTRRYFLAFEYEPSTNRFRTIDEIANELQSAVYKIKAGLGNCGNELIEPANEDFFQAEILYTFLNRRSCTEEEFADRVCRVTSDTMRMKGLVEGVDDYPDIPIVDYIAPRGMDFTHPDYYICDGLYSTILMVTKEGYPTQVTAGWMSTLIETGDGIDIDVILRKENRATTKERVALKLKLNRIKANERSDIDTDFEQIQNAIYSAQYIKNALSNGEDFFKMYTFITVSAETLEGLNLQLERVNDYLYSNDIEVKQIKWRLEDAFQVVCPILSYKKELFDFAGRNVMTSGASSTYMMTSAEICDDYGIVMGVNRRYQSLVNMDIFNTKKYKNANICIVGTSGAGKTYTELLMAMRMREQRIQTFIISPDKAHEFRRACVALNGSYIRISPGSQSCINIMEIRPAVNPIAEFLDEGDGEGDSWLSQKSTQLLTFFHLLVDDLTNEEEQLTDEAIIKTYLQYGITHNNKSIYNQDQTVKQMPIIGDLHKVLLEREETRRVANILARFVSGSAQSFNRRTNVDLDNKFIVFDLQDLSGRLKAIGMFVVMDFLWSRIKEDRTERKAIFIDEAWQLIGASTDNSVADFVYRIFKIIRGYGGSAILATQDISDLFSYQEGKFGKAILSNSKTKIILQLEQGEAKAIQDALELTKREVQDIINFNRGEALICANNNKVPISIRASDMEHKLITTDPRQLKEIVEAKKREAQAAAQQIQQTHTTSETEEGPVETAARMIDEDSAVPQAEIEKECVVETGYEKTIQAQQKRAEREKTRLDISMQIQAIEQLGDNVVVKNPDGSIDQFEPDVPFVPVPEEDERIQEITVAGVNSGSNNRAKSPEKNRTAPVDLDLEDDEDEGGIEQAPGESTQPKRTLNERRSHYDYHPPAGF